MKQKVLVLGLLLLMGCSFQAQAQKILVLDKRGKVKRLRYYEGEWIKLKLLSGQLLMGKIAQLSDSSFRVSGHLVRLDSVKRVYNTQKLLGLKLTGAILSTAGVIYFPLDSFNRIINDDSPVFNESSAKVSGLLLGAGLICIGISNKSYKISKKRPLKVLDLSI